MKHANESAHIEASEVMPQFGQCQKCKRNRLLTHRVRSKIIDLAVCRECADAAEVIERRQQRSEEGKIHVEAIQ